MLNIIYRRIGVSRFEENQDFSCESNFSTGSHASKCFNTTTRSRPFDCRANRFFSDHFVYPYGICQKSYLFEREHKLLQIVVYEKSLPDDCDTF